MATRKYKPKHIGAATGSYVGEAGELILNTSTNTLKVSDGSTAGGVTLTTDGGGGGSALGIKVSGDDSTAISVGDGELLNFRGRNGITVSASTNGSEEEIEISGASLVALTGSTNNQVTTVTGANAITGESNLTFNGSALAVTGSITSTSTITATSRISAMNLSVQLGTDGLQIGNGTNGDDTTYRIIYDANTNEGGSTEIYAKRPANNGGDTKFWFPRYSDVSGLTRYIVTTAVDGGSSGGTAGLTGNLDTWFGDITFDGNTISTGSSNADLELDASGTGRVVLKAPLSLLTSQPDGSSAAIDITTNVAFLDGNSNSSEKMNYTLANGTYVGQFVQLVRNSGTFDSINVTARMLGSNGTESSSQVEVFSQYDSIRIFIWSGTAWVSTRGGGHP